ncbi:MAG: helix-turn-helix domain-containing protein [Candidatus Gracilibacteria bacterium]
MAKFIPMLIYKKLKKLLFDAGLSEAEIFLYLELLKNPAQTIYELTNRTKLPRSTVYYAFSRLEGLKLVENNKEGIRALSLKSLVAELATKERKFRKTAHKIKQIAPFLRAPRESIQEFETFYTPEQIIEAYFFMAEVPYDTNFDFGDFESFINAIGPVDLAFKFREKRAKHAKHHAICTTFGPKLAQFCNKQDLERYKNRFDVFKQMDFCNKWIIFSDTSEYVLFNDVSDPEYPCSLLVKSKPLAEIQRMQFNHFSNQL